MKTHSSVGRMAVWAVLGATIWTSSTRSIAAPNADGTPKREWKNGGKGGFGAQKLAAKLNLSEAQKSQIQSISTRARADAQAVKSNEDLTPEQKRAQTKTIRNNARQAINAVLTPAQREQLKQMRREGRSGKGGKGRGGDSVKFAQKLNLSLSQQAQIKTIRQSARADIEAVKSNTSLTQEQKREQLKAIHNNVQNAISAVLTPAQREQWKAMKAERKARREADRGERKGARGERKANRNNGLNS